MVNKILGLFLYQKDEDIAADDVFRHGFLNLVNFFMLVFSVTVAIHALLIESAWVAIYNLIAALLFFAYYICAFIPSAQKFMGQFNKLLMLLYYSTVIGCHTVTKFAPVVMFLYPFVALVLHGRRIGVIFSTIQIVVSVITFVVVHLVIPEPKCGYTAYDIAALCVIMVSGLLIYLYVIRWLSGMLYDKIREVTTLTEDIGVNHELLQMLGKQMIPPMQNILTSSARLRSTNLTQVQQELAGIIYAGAVDARNRVKQIARAAQFNVLPVEDEQSRFNIYSLVTNTLMVFGQSAHKLESKHHVVASSEVPRMVVGNQLLTRQILLAIFNALDRKGTLRTLPVKVNITVIDILVNGVVLNFSIQTEMNVAIDHRDMGNDEEKLISALDLYDARRLVDSAEGNFMISYVGGWVSIDFSQRFAADQGNTSDNPENPDLSVTQTIILRRNVSLNAANVQAVVNGSGIEAELVTALRDQVGKLSLEAGTAEALDHFVNTRFDVCILGLGPTRNDDRNRDAYAFIRRLRDIEEGMGTHTVVVAIQKAPANADINGDAINARADAVVVFPDQADQLPSIITRLLGE